MTAYYFASRYSRHAELRQYRDQLLTIPDAKVTSRWIDLHGGEFPESFEPDALSADPAGCWPNGKADLDDLRAASVIVSFTGPGGKGGRHVEHGYAMALRMRIVLVGPRENVFHCYPPTEVYDSWVEFLGHESLAIHHPSLLLPQ